MSLIRKAIGLSVVLHILFVFFIFKKREEKQISEKRYAYLDLLKKPISKPVKENRLVQTEEVDPTETPKEKAYLARQNQVVERETQSKEIKMAGGNKKPLSQKLKSIIKPHFALNAASQPLQAPPPSEWATPGLRPSDTLLGLPDSDRTALNTKEYQFYSYFQRIRARLDQAWVPLLRSKLGNYYQSGRRLASEMNHTTELSVILNREGEIKRVLVRSESGTEELDQAAIQAFNQAGPFPNPPRGLIDQNDEVEIPWDFILKT